MAKEQLEQAIADLGLSVVAEFVPYSKSRSFKKDAKMSERNLNWKVTLYRHRRVSTDEDREKSMDKRLILTTDYSAGIAHCPSYSQASLHRMSVDTAEALAYETERGHVARSLSSVSGFLAGKPILPETIDVVHSLVQDASVLDHSTFESWAGDYGYDTDSRKAEETYKACLAIALALRNGVGEDGFRKLQEAAQDY